MTVKEIVINQIMDRLKKGFIPWIKPWQGGEAVNYVTQKPYTGVNRLLLDGGEYLTFKQIKDCGGHLKKGSKASIVVFYKPIIEVDDETGEEIVTSKILRYYNVFSINDCEGITSKQEITCNENYSIENCEDLIQNYLTKSGVGFETKASQRAYYSPSDDKIVVPLIQQFNDSQNYYATAFHEMIHSTGHKSRLDRQMGTAHFGSKDYGQEELVAEIGSSILCNKQHIDSASLIENSVGYIQNWLQALKNDTNMIFKSAAAAEKAVDFITG